MKNIFVLGCKGIPANYGGYETFVENLTKGQIDKTIKYHVACIGDESKEYNYNDAHCFQIKVPHVGPARAMLADILAFKYLIEYVKKNNINDFTVLVLACRMGIVFKHYVKLTHKLGGKVIINPDGHEWKRSKWPWIIKKYWKYSEAKMVKFSDLVICDSINIENYINTEYKKYNPKTTFIAYGADISKSIIEETDHWVHDFMEKNKIKPYNYYLIVGRFVPENNYETMIREFMSTSVKKDLVIITNYKDSGLYEKLRNKLHFENDSRIKFVGTVYQPEYIKNIREKAYGYLHGHSVGGTNPSLLEALASTRLNLLYDCGFNKEVGEGSSLYWSLEEGDLKKLLEQCDSLSDEELNTFDLNSKKIIMDRYNWKLIISKYEQTY